MTNETDLPDTVPAQRGMAGECGNPADEPSPHSCDQIPDDPLYDDFVPDFDHDFVAEFSNETPLDDYQIKMAAENAAKCVMVFDEDMSPEAMREVLERMMFNDSQGEAALMLQAQVLDSMFHRVAQSALTAPKWSLCGGGGPALDSSKIQIAMRAQMQCRTTYDSLRRLRENESKQAALKAAKNNFTNEIKDV